MSHWFTERFIDTGRLPIFFLLVAFVLTFLFIRFSVRMIRAQVSWWPGNVTPGGMHIHHVIFGRIQRCVRKRLHHLRGSRHDALVGILNVPLVCDVEVRRDTHGKKKPRQNTRNAAHLLPMNADALHSFPCAANCM